MDSVLAAWEPCVSLLGACHSVVQWFHLPWLGSCMKVHYIVLESVRVMEVG